MRRCPLRRHRSEPLRLESLESRRLLAVLANGEEVLDAIGTGGSESFSFQAGNLESVRVSVGERGVGAEPRVQVFDPRGLLVDQNHGFDSALVEFTAYEAGWFTAVVSDNADNDALDYRIRVVSLPTVPTLIPGRDEYLDNGNEALTSIEVGAFNLHRFDALAADTVRFSVGETGGSAEPAFKLYGPDGVLVVSKEGDASAAVEFSAPADGTYTAVVFDNGNSEALDYRVRVLTVPGEVNLIDGRDSTLASGQEVLSQFAAGGFNLHQFEVGAMDTFRVSVGEIGGSAEPKVQVYDPAGELVGGSSGFTAAAVQYTPLTGGTYTAVVSDDADNDALAYRVRVVTIPSVPVMLDGRDSMLTSGAEAIGSLAVGTFNLHQFTANAHDTVRLAAGEIDGDGEPRLQVFDSVGRPVASDTSAGSGVVQFSAPSDGVYTAIVSDDGDSEPITYAIRMLRLPGEPTLLERDSTLANGDEVYASLGIGRFNLHKLTVGQPGTIRISVGETGGVGEPELQVFGPDGEALASHTGSASALAQFEATATGDYTIVVNDSEDNDALDYRIRAISLPGEAAYLEGRDSLAPETTASGATIAIGSFNYHTFTAPGTTDFRLSATRTDGPGEPTLQVFGPAGNLIASTAAGTEAVVEFSTVGAGRYTAVVSDAGNEEELTYDFALTTSASFPGDYNGDRVVDDADAAVWAAGYGGLTAEALIADGNGDSQVDAADYTLWRDNQSTPLKAAPMPPATVIEPVEPTESPALVQTALPLGPMETASQAEEATPTTADALTASVADESLLLYLAALGTTQATEDDSDEELDLPYDEALQVEVPQELANKLLTSP